MPKTVRRDSTALEDLPNVGPAVAADLRRLRIRTPQDLRGGDPLALYEELNRVTGTRHDPCVLDTFIAIVRYVDGGPARPWWHYTAQRKRMLAQRAAPAPAGPARAAGTARPRVAAARPAKAPHRGA